MKSFRPWLVTIVIALLMTGSLRGDTATLVPVRDNTLFESATGSLSNGAGNHLFAGRTAQPASISRRRALLAFDVSAAIPPGSVVTSVSLTLHLSLTSTGPTPQQMRRVLADWGSGASMAGGNEGAGGAALAGDATWQHTFFSSVFWASPGGDFSPTVSASAVIDGVGFHTFTSTPELVADVQDFVDNPLGNFGWVIVGDELLSGTAKRYDSRENPDPSVRPILTIEYTPPGETCCMPPGGCVNLLAADCLLAGGTPTPQLTACEGDGDGDGVDVNCGDECPADSDKYDPGQCGCGVPDSDPDFDGTADCLDDCPLDPLKVDPGICGCGVQESNSDAGQGCDDLPDCVDSCPFDCFKTEPGICGCNNDDLADTDGDGLPDCIDLCPGVDDAVFAPGCTGAVPTLSAWGMVVLLLSLCTLAKLRGRLA